MPGPAPHLGTFVSCEERPLAIVVGASNTWFAQTLATLAVSATRASALQAKVAELWEFLENVSSREILDAFWVLPQFQVLHRWGRARSSTRSGSTRRPRPAARRRSTRTC